MILRLHILKIYERYTSDTLVRKDFKFEKNLTIKEFIFKYFDRVVFQSGSLLCFFPKVISEEGSLISVPPWSYYDARVYLHSRVNNAGCIFLRKKFTKESSNNGCILHNNNAYENITEKPIDCLFLTCSADMKQIRPSSAESRLWFALLDYHFPNSNKRFNDNHPGMPC